MLAWGDVFMAYHTTGIPHIEDYAVFRPPVFRQMALSEVLRPLFRLRFVREALKAMVRPGPTPVQMAATTTHVWGEARDDEGQSVASRLHGPDAGGTWTSRTAVAAAQRLLAGEAPPGFQTPARAFGADFVFAVEGVTREDIT